METEFDRALALLPLPFIQAAQALEERIKENAEEFRLRTGQVMTVCCGGQEHAVSNTPPVTAQHIAQVLETASRASLYACADSLRRGYLTASDGCRIGVCGSAVLHNGTVATLRDISSLCIRIAREKRGIADGLLPHLYRERMENTLLLSPPGGGKTTLLRDLIRALSEKGCRVGVADERGELAAMRAGKAGFSIGPATDVIDGAPKAYAVELLLRTMTPQVVALDEIGSEEDAAAVHHAANCGTAILATAHGLYTGDAHARPFLSALCGTVFTHAVIITQTGTYRTYKVCRL